MDNMSNSTLNKEQRYQLIELVKERRVLYDKQHRLWRSVKEKEYRWKEIGELCNATDVACKKAWKTLRDQYHRYLRMPKNKRKKYRYLQELSFLGGATENSSNNEITDNLSDYSDYSEPEPEQRKPSARSTTFKNSINKSKNSVDDEDDATMSHSSENDHEEYIYVKDVADADKSVGNVASELFSTFNTLLNKRFELNEDDNDVFLRMLAKKMKCLPNIVKNRLQECFLEQVNYETLQCSVQK